MVVYNWISKYSKIVEKYLKEIIPRTSDRAWIRADEVWLKVAVDKKYLFTSIGGKTPAEASNIKVDVLNK